MDFSLSKRSEDLAILLGAGEGKRMRSTFPKVLHALWGMPSILRIASAVQEGLGGVRPLIVVSVKHADQIQRCFMEHGYNDKVTYCLQHEPKGTGHAVQVAMNVVKPLVGISRNVYVFPGDMGLMSADLIRLFQEAFLGRGADMMLLTGTFEGSPHDNHYGRVLRTCSDSSETADADEPLLGIVQYKDIMAMKAEDTLIKTHLKKSYTFTKDELLKIKEYDALGFAFKESALREQLYTLDADNSQGECYLTDCVERLLRSTKKVLSYRVADADLLMGFNDQKTLKRMESLARKRCYRALEGIVSMADKDDFFIHDEVQRDLISRFKTRNFNPIIIEKGAKIGRGVRLGEGVHIGRDVCLGGEGELHLESGVILSEKVSIITDIEDKIRLKAGTYYQEDPLFRKIKNENFT